MFHGLFVAKIWSEYSIYVGIWTVACTYLAVLKLVSRVYGLVRKPSSAFI